MSLINIIKIIFIISIIIKLMSFFGVELNSQINKLNLQIRLNLSRNRHTPNLRTLYKSLYGLDKGATGVLHIEDFEKVQYSICRLWIRMDCSLKSLRYRPMRRLLLVVIRDLLIGKHSWHVLNNLCQMKEESLSKEYLTVWIPIRQEWFLSKLWVCLSIIRPNFQSCWI